MHDPGTHRFGTTIDDDSGVQPFGIQPQHDDYRQAFGFEIPGVLTLATTVLTLATTVLTSAWAAMAAMFHPRVSRGAVG